LRIGGKESVTPDLTGQRSGRLTVICRLNEKKCSSYLWLCKCSCGNIVKTGKAELLGEHKKSCGRLMTEHCKKLLKKYKESHCEPCCGAGLRGRPLRSRSTDRGAVSNGNRHAFITVNKQTCHLGTYSEIQQAVLARRKAEELVLNQTGEQSAEALDKVFGQPNKQ